MRKLLKLFQFISFFSIIGSLPVACTQRDPDLKKLSISDNEMNDVTTKINVGSDKYQDVLINDNSKTSDKCFKTLLISNMNSFASTNKITLDYSVDYKFDIEGIKDPYQIIDQTKTIIIDVKASNKSKKIIGMFKVNVNLVSVAKSINGVGAKIGNQIYKDIIVDKTTFQEVINSYLNLIQSEIAKIDSRAIAYRDYTIFFQGDKFTDVVNKTALGNAIVNINAVGASSENPMLEGSTSFIIELIEKK